MQKRLNRSRGCLGTGSSEPKRVRLGYVLVYVSVCLCVCVFGTLVSRAKTAQMIETLFVVNSRNLVLDGSPDPAP